MIAIGTEPSKFDSWRICVLPSWTISRLQTPTKRRMSQSISWPHVPFSFFRYASGICWYSGIQDLWFSLGKDHLLASNAACRQTQAVKTMRCLVLVSSTIFGRAARALLQTGRQRHWIIPPVENGVPNKVNKFNQWNMSWSVYWRKLFDHFFDHGRQCGFPTEARSFYSMLWNLTFFRLRQTLGLLKNQEVSTSQLGMTGCDINH